MEEDIKKYTLIEDRQWNDEGIKVVFTGTHNECFIWIHKNTPFSFHEAIANQGYSIVEVKDEEDEEDESDVYSEEFQVKFYEMLKKFVEEYDDMANMGVMKKASELLEEINQM